MGLMSLIEDMEEVPHPQFGWWEERFILASSSSTAYNAAGPFASNVDGSDLTAAGWSQAIGDTIRISVADASLYKQRDNIRMFNVPTTGTAVDITGIVLSVETDSDEYIVIRLTTAVTNALNNSTANSLNVLVSGTSSAEGSRSTRGTYKFPTEVSNYTQIFKTTVGPFTRNAIKEPLRFESEGVYKKTTKDALIDHMTRMEQACFWGTRRSTLVQNEDGDTVPERETGGVKYFLDQWDKGNIANGGLFDYRPGGTDMTAITWAQVQADTTGTYDDKRVLRINGTVTEDDFMEKIIARAFFRTGNLGFQKLVFGGSGFMSVFNRFVKMQGIITVQQNNKEETYGMEVTKWKSLHGELLFSTHPLFNENHFQKYSGFIIDLGSIGWHPFQDSDTTKIDNIQANDVDGRKDMWITEGGLELKMPERHLYIEGLKGIDT